MAEPGQFDRQCAADVGQSAGLGKRHRFARGQQDVHAQVSLLALGHGLGSLPQDNTPLRWLARLFRH